jgi:hypothetical protein
MSEHVLPLSGQLDFGIVALKAFDGRYRDALESAFFLQRFQYQTPIRVNLIMPVQMNDIEKIACVTCHGR